MSTKSDLIATLVANGQGSPEKLRRHTIAVLTEKVDALPQSEPTHAVVLMNMTDGSVQGHAAGCKDLTRKARGKVQFAEPVQAADVWNVASKREAYLEYNADFIAESGTEEGHWEITWLPCADHVPSGEAKGSTIATADGVVIAEQRHVEAEEAPLAADHVFAARGNYNTVWVPLALLLAADPRHAVRVWIVKQSAMLVDVNIVGSGSEQFAELLERIETDAVAALTAWQKTVDRQGQTDMEKYNQNRSFLAGFGAAVAQRVSSAKQPPVVAFARDMEKALRRDALKAGLVAGKASA